MIKLKLENQFSLEILVSKFNSKPALTIGESTYTYQELFELVQTAANRFKNRQGNVIKLVNKEPFKFIINFLAIIQTRNYPFVASFDRSQLSFKNTKLNSQTFFLGLTSGTTGQPKIYYRDWQSWKKGFDWCNKLFKLTSIQNIITGSPLTTSLGLHTLILSLYLGKNFCLLNNSCKSRCLKKTTALFAVPTFLLQRSNITENIPNFKKIFLGGGTLTPQNAQKIRCSFPQAELFEFYGSSETSFISWQKITRKKITSSAGQLFPNVKVSFGSHHEIIATSPYLFSGYLGQPSPRICVTDDLGVLKGDQLFLTGRKADLIDHGGNKISPFEVEAVVNECCPNCIVFGVKDSKLGQKIALLTTETTTKQLLVECLRRHLPSFKCPDIYLRTTKFPLSLNQKISRVQLAQAYERGEFNEF